jgi:hypothetical protein
VKIAAWLLRCFAFALIGVLGLALYYAPELRDTLGPGSWWASLLPLSPVRIAVWLGAASLNAGAALLLAAYLES